MKLLVSVLLSLGQLTFGFHLNAQNNPTLPDNANYGITRQENGDITFRIHAPGKDNVVLLGDFNNWTPDPAYTLNKGEIEGDFWISVSGLDSLQWHTYQYLINGALLVADPFSELVLDQSHDGFLLPDRNLFFPKFPQGRSGQVSAFTLGGFSYQWQHNEYKIPEKENLFIYELLIRDFLGSHHYDDLTDTLDYLKKLGVNAIELMPVNEFEGNISWGYNPSFHMALDKYYGDPLSFKRFIDAAHQKGMIVILDVVFNHAFSQSPFAKMYWDAILSRPSAENPWLNPIARHPFNVGYDFNHESLATKLFVQQVLQYWINEFHIDGFRFDLSKGLTQVNSGDDVGTWSRLDASRIEILKEIGNSIWAQNPEAILILEHFADNTEEKVLSDLGFLLWGNMNYNFNEATMGYHDLGKSDFSWGYYRNRGWQFPHLVTYMESHDEERIMFKNLAYGNSSGNYNVKDLETALNRTKMAHIFFWTIPGPKMIWQFGELGYDLSINYCQNTSISDQCRTDPKPIQWNYRSNASRLDLYEFISDLTALKASFPESFSKDLSRFEVRTPVKSLQFGDENLTGIAIGNFEVKTMSYSFSFPEETRVWYDYLSGDSLVVRTNPVEFSLQPGEYHLWLNKKLFRPRLNGISTSVYDKNGISDKSFKLKLLGNPVRAGHPISFQVFNSTGPDCWIRLFDLSGRTIYSGKHDLNAGNTIQLQTDHLSAGLFILSVQDGKTRESQKIIISN